MAHEIFMPALGMTQDTGIIVAWHKQPGDAVSTTDILAEVETDKTTMEIEVGFDGILASLRAEVGVPVPVGEIIAVIAATQEEAGEITQWQPSAHPPVEAAPTAAASSGDAKSPVPETPIPDPLPSAAPARPPISAGGRILASPKTRRLARERGIDLGRLVAQGLTQPFHAADLDKIRPREATSLDELGARADASAFESFHRWAETQSGTSLHASRIWAAFSAACLRASTDGDRSAPLNIRVTSLGLAGEDEILQNPDQTGLLTPTRAAGDAPVHLAIVDLGGTVFSSYRPADPATVPTLTVTRTGGDNAFDLKLQFSDDRFPLNSAIEFLTGLVERAEEPLRQLL